MSPRNKGITNGVVRKQRLPVEMPVFHLQQGESGLHCATSLAVVLTTSLCVRNCRQSYLMPYTGVEAFDPGILWQNPYEAFDPGILWQNPYEASHSIVSAICDCKDRRLYHCSLHEQAHLCIHYQHASLRQRYDSTNMPSRWSERAETWI
jgi:hypothetical protein